MFLQIGNGATNVTVDHNTVLQTGSIITAYGRSKGAFIPIPGFRFTNNLTLHNAYGIFGSGAGYGKGAIEAFFPDSEIASNVMAGGPSSRYPAGNFFPSVAQLMADFTDASKSNFRLTARSPYRKSARDGSDLGANFDLITRAQLDLGR